MKLLGYMNLTGEMQCHTALRIGGSNDVIEIGGLDNPIIKHPLTRAPFVPGSSLKGKMRALLEVRYGMIDARRKVNGQDNRDFGDVHTWGGVGCKRDQCPICRVFGVAKGNDSPFGPARLIVRDARLIGNRHIIENLDSVADEDERRHLAERVFETERKWENTINRITGVANPRQMERVPEGAIFEFTMSYRVYDTDGDDGKTDLDLFPYVLLGLRLIELDALGGSGSRGYGKVSFGTVDITLLNGTSKQIKIADVPTDDTKFKEWAKQNFPFTPSPSNNKEQQ